MTREGTITVSVKGLLVTGVVLLALLTAYLLGGSGDGTSASAEPGAQAAPADATAHAGRLTMTGSGKATAVPDQLTFSLGVGVTRTDLDTALSDANKITGRVLDAIGRYGVERGDVQTTGLSMNPVYDYPAYSPPVLRGYHVSQRATVLVDELKKGGRVIGATIDAGGNDVRVSNIRLKIGDPEAVLAKARQAAVAEATAKAQEYADATGQDLGDVLTLREVRASSPRTPAPLAYANARAAMDTVAGLAMPIRTGREDLSVTVQVVWEFAGGSR
jgi:uncharacterized protein YggE